MNLDIYSEKGRVQWGLLTENFIEPSYDGDAQFFSLEVRQAGAQGKRAIAKVSRMTRNSLNTKFAANLCISSFR